MTTQTSEGNGAGAPSDFGSAFGTALVAAVREQEDREAEANVAAAITLGWYLAALAHPGAMTATAAAARGDLMTLTALSDSAVADFCLSQVEVARGKLAALVTRATLELPALDELRRCIDSAQDAARREAAGEVDGKALAVLAAADARLGKAYGAGRALLVLTTPPSPDAALRDHLTRQRVAPVVAAVDDLTSALPAHAGQSVRRSLLEWEASVVDDSSVVPKGREAWWQLARQGELWRSLLSGEKSGLDMLSVEDYIDAADRLAGRLRAMAGLVLGRFKWAAIGVGALILFGIALVVIFPGQAAAVVAGAGSILAGLGLTWRGAGRTLGGLAGKVERPLWGAELDAAITQAITLLEREDPDALDAARQRRANALALGEAAAPRAGG